MIKKIILLIFIFRCFSLADTNPIEINLKFRTMQHYYYDSFKLPKEKKLKLKLKDYENPDIKFPERFKTFYKKNLTLEKNIPFYYYENKFVFKNSIKTTENYVLNINTNNICLNFKFNLENCDILISKFDKIDKNPQNIFKKYNFNIESDKKKYISLIKGNYKIEIYKNDKKVLSKLFIVDNEIKLQNIILEK